jgi:hypothetical protein
MLYWPAVEDLLAPHPAMRVWAVVLAVAMSALLFVVLRDLRVPRLHAGALSVLVLLFPSSDSTRLWPAASVGTLAVILCLAGAIVTFRALRTTNWRAAGLHVVGLGLYATALLMYEAPAGLLLLSGLAYLRIGRRRGARVRWLLDVVLVITTSLIFTADNFYSVVRSAMTGGTPGRSPKRLCRFLGALRSQ